MNKFARIVTISILFALYYVDRIVLAFIPASEIYDFKKYIVKNTNILYSIIRIFILFTLYTFI